MAWSPLAGGYLTGKHLDRIKTEEEEVTRLNDSKSVFPIQVFKKLFYDQHHTEKNIAALKELIVFAEKELECSLTHLAIAWTIKFQYVNTALIGARTVAQLEDSLKALPIVEKLTTEI